MKNKVFLPVVAMIFAIGMSFASVTSDRGQEYDYIHLGGDSWQQIDEMDCPEGTKTCRVQLGEGGPVYDVFDESNLQSRKTSVTGEPIIINP